MIRLIEALNFRCLRYASAVETMYQSLSSVYDAQLLLATHSPVILSLAEAGNVL